MRYHFRIEAGVIYFLFFLLSLQSAMADEYYVSPDGSGSNSGMQGSPWSLDKANKTVQAGDTVILLDGIYKTNIAPRRSGEKGKRIVYRAANAQKAVFKALKQKTGIVLVKRSYVTVDGIIVDKVRRYIDAHGSHHITINKCRFVNAYSGTFSKSRFINSGDGIHYTNNYIEDGGDLVTIGPSDHHLIENNFFGNASHTGLVVHGIRNSVIRNNTFVNPEWKCMEVFTKIWGDDGDTRGGTRDVGRIVRYNLIEGNRFGFTSSSGIQYAGSSNILRKNIYRLCITGMPWANYRSLGSPLEGWHDSSNRFYNNVIVDCGRNERNKQLREEYNKKGLKVAEKYVDGFAMSIGSGFPEWGDYGDNVMINNIIYRNRNAKDAKIEYTVQISLGSPPVQSLFYLSHNIIMCEKPGQNVFRWAGAESANPKMSQYYTLKQFEQTFPDIAANNLEADPRFIDTDQGDFRLKPQSPCIDAGSHLTRTTVKGDKSVYVYVGDATFFTDGYGIIEPDVIRVGDEKVTVIKADYDTNLLIVDREISWDVGTPVSLDYKGKAPDIGVYEFGE